MNTHKKNHTGQFKGVTGAIVDLFQRPFPVMEDWEVRWVVIVFHGLFAAAFLILFKPFQDVFSSGSIWINAGFGLVVSLVLAFNHFLISKVLAINLKNWTIGKSIVCTLYDVVTVILGVFIYNNYWTNFENFSWAELFNIGSVTLILAIIPVSISTILLENWLLRRNLRKASQMQESVNHVTGKTFSESDDLIMIYSENKGEWIKVRPSSLIFLESADNYVNILFKEKEKIQKKLLRSTLKNIENQLTQPFIKRCHRSYMVNLHQIQFVDGNSRGLQLQLLDVNKIIPVSRKYVRSILEEIGTKT